MKILVTFLTEEVIGIISWSGLHSKHIYKCLEPLQGVSAIMPNVFATGETMWKCMTRGLIPNTFTSV
jgi:hypothetical protein